MTKKKLKLTIELVPKTCWSESLRNSMRRKRWDKFRKQVIEQAGGKCQLCGSTDKLHCHEIWNYSDKARIQRLIGFQTVCNMCHFAKHIGLAQRLSTQGYLDFDAVVNHFLKVNKVKNSVFEEHLLQASRLWKKRSKCKWKTDLGEFKYLVMRNGA